MTRYLVREKWTWLMPERKMPVCNVNVLRCSITVRQPLTWMYPCGYTWTQPEPYRFRQLPLPAHHFAAIQHLYHLYLDPAHFNSRRLHYLSRRAPPHPGYVPPTMASGLHYPKSWNHKSLLLCYRLSLLILTTSNTGTLRFFWSTSTRHLGSQQTKLLNTNRRKKHRRRLKRLGC